MATHMSDIGIHLQRIFLSLPLVFFSALLAYAVIKVFYNLFLHPLRSYPGPLFARCTVLVAQREALAGRAHIWPQELHKRYGPVVRVKPNELSFIEPGYWKDAHGYKSSRHVGSFPKDVAFYGPDSFGNPPGLIRADDLAHGRQRKMVSHAFSDKALREQQELLKGYVMLLVEKLQEAAKSGTAVNIVDWFNFTTFDIMADLTFGEPLKLLDGSEYTPWVSAIFGNLKLICISNVIRAWPGAETCLNALVPKTIKEQKKMHMRHSVDRVEKRLQHTSDRPDIWGYVMRSEENKGLSLATTEKHSNSALFMLAGTETTATELSGLTYMLLKNPERMERIKKELYDAFATSDDMTMLGLSHLSYMNACIEEGLRMYPPVPVSMTRIVPGEGENVAGHWVPGGTAIGLPNHAAYHSPSNFKHPDSFIPERWLPEGENEFSQDRKEVFQPFSYGPRNCLGKNLAYHEMRLVLANILWHFDLELCDQTANWLDQRVFTFWEKKPLMVRLTPVKH